MAAGIIMFLSAVGLALYNYYTEYKAGADSALIMEQLASEISYRGEDIGKEEPDYVLNPHMDLPVKEIDSHRYVGVLEVFSLGLELPVMEEWSYENFRISPCVYEGTPYRSGFIIAAHNYRSHFGNIRQLTVGDKLAFTDINNNVFNYKVAGSEIVDRNAVSELTAGDWDLSLFTCTPGGRSRVVVRCELVED